MTQNPCYAIVAVFSIKLQSDQGFLFFFCGWENILKKVCSFQNRLYFCSINNKQNDNRN